METTDTSDPAGVAVRHVGAGATRPAERRRNGGLTIRNLRRWAWLLPVGVVGVIVALPVAGMWVAPGPTMEEGFMLVFPERVLAGDVANRDFLHLYGPASLWVLAAAYGVAGVELWVERLVGLAQLVGLIGAITFVGYRWGRWVATVAGVTTAVVILPAMGLVALAWIGGLALSLWAVIVVVRGLDPSHDPERVPAWQRRHLLLGGALGGLGLLFRPDLVLALGLPLGVLWVWAVPRGNRRWLAAGVLGGASPYLLHLALAGPANVVRGVVTEPLFELRAGRSLGFPPPWDSFASYLNRLVAFRNWPWPLPSLMETHQIFLWALILVATCMVLVAIGLYAHRARSPDGWRLLALGLFAVGTLPQAIQRPDATHLAWVSAVPFGLVPMAVAEWFRLRGGAPRIRVVAVLAPIVVMLAIIPSYTVRWYADYVGQTMGYRRDGHEIEHRGRSFYYGRAEVADAAHALLRDVERVSQPGDRLIVGPGDLRRTPYSEAYLYYLLPQLDPGTRYIEMDPGVANASDSGLADELREADVVILSTLYDGWEEPNASMDPGSREPNRVLAQDYCLHGRYGDSAARPGRGHYELYVRCGDAPATTPVTPLPGDDIIPEPDTGQAPEDPGDRGGVLQIALFVGIVAGVGVIVAMVVRESRRRRQGRSG